MKLNEFATIPLTEEELVEAYNLDFVNLYRTYGSWWHPQKPQPVMVTNPHEGHEATAEKIVGRDPSVPIRYTRDDILKKMYNKGWVRAVHGGMNSFSLTGPAENLRQMIPKLVALKNAVNTINIDIQDCSGDHCISKGHGTFTMPGEWGKLRQAIS